MKRKSESAEPEKVHRLTLAELASHDDACSDAMIDNAYFKSQIRKNKTKYFPLRIKEDDVPQILLHKVIVQKDPVAAEKELLRLTGFKRYRSTLKSKAEQENFLKHLRKYIYMYQTDCPWEVSTTNRYTITTYEAAVTARQRIKQGQTVKYLVGTMVPLTMEESIDLDHTNRNFSIVVSSRKKNSSIFLGPARFANHDCDANGRLVMRGNDAMEVIAMKNIDIGDEITVSYGDDYFGPENADCLCHTCERLIRNGWAGARDVSNSPRNSVTSSQEPGSPAVKSSKRKRETEPEFSDSAVLKQTKRAKAKTSPSKLQHSWTPTSSVDSETIEVAQTVIPDEEANSVEQDSIITGDLALSPPASLSNESGDLENLSAQTVRSDEQDIDKQYGIVTRRRSSGMGRPSNESKINKITARVLANGPSKTYPPSPASTATSFAESTNITSAESTPLVDEVVVKIESVETTQDESDTIVVLTDVPTNEMMLEEETQNPKVITTLTTTKVTKSKPLITDTITVVPSIEPTVNTTSTTVQISVTHVSDRTRVPGDYILTRRLLAQPHDRWVQCLNEPCQSFFIQPNGYQTRRECPRCERHSMLYGFSWPKTDPDLRKLLERSPGGRKGKPKTERSAYRRAGRTGKGTWYEGGGDEEERVMDHRTVHRFVLPEDERAITRRGLLNDAEKARATGADFDPFELNAGGRRRTESVGLNGRVDSSAERGSLTPDGELRRRSNRFVTKVGLYADG